MARTYREIAIEEMLRTVEEAMSRVIDSWGDLPLRVAAKRAERKRDENSDRRRERRDRPALVHRLRANQHEVFALTRSPDSAPLKEIGSELVIADALDAACGEGRVGRIRPDAVINELTSLPRHYTPAEMAAAAERDRKVRVEGNINLLVALRDAGVRRYLLQSSGFWYAPGAGLADESVPFISSASPGVEAGARTYLELEARASATPGIEFVALRYGFFYGPGTWYTREGDIGDQVRQHIDDAAGATAAALECPPGAYNIVDGNPSPQHLWLAARAAGAPAPPRLSEEEALRASGPDAVYYATRLRGASNEKARRELEFRPRPLEWI